MSDSSLGASPSKRQRKDTVTTAKNKKNAFDIMLDSSKLCWPPGDDASHMPILQMVAENGWFPWNTDESSCQNLDYSNLRLVSKDMKEHMDNPTNGGPDFEDIVSFLDLKNGFDDDEGFCDHCYSNEGVDCDTCEDDGYNYSCCNCKKSHRYGPALLQLDPRLNPNVEFQTLSLRYRAKLLLQFIRQVASNFHAEYYDEWDKINARLVLNCENEFEDENPDLTMIDPQMMYWETAVFVNQFKEYNPSYYNFIHHLLFTGWAGNDCYSSPGSCSPFRGRLIGDKKDYNDWNGGHREWFHEMWECFMCLHKSDEEKTIPPRSMLLGSWHESNYSLSQIQYLPETIRRCVMNCVDKEAETLLGKSIADSIDIYRLVRETYASFGGDYLKAIQWMPCLGVSEEEYEPLDSFEGYNPQHKRFGEVADNIDSTGLRWGLEAGNNE